jgi:hypothetical protein
MSAAMSLPAPALRTLGEDGTLHFGYLKHMAKSGLHYLYAVNTKTVPTRAMKLGSLVNHLVLGKPPAGKTLVRFTGDARRGKAWDAFEAEHCGEDIEILTAPEWDEGEAIAAAIRHDPVAQARLLGGRYEMPLAWEEDGVPCSTSGIDIVNAGALADLKTTTTTEPEAWKRQAFKMFYHCQMAWYRRGARANGIDTSCGLYVLGVEVKPPFAVVELEMTEGLIDLADRTLSLWLERLKTFRQSMQFPGYAQAPIPWDVPGWMIEEEGEDDDE